MISYERITRLFVKEEECIEIEFMVHMSDGDRRCWMGKLPKEHGKELFWFGLKEDGTQSYDFYCFRDFTAAPVFNGQSLRECWEKIEILSIDGFDPQEILELLQV